MEYPSKQQDPDKPQDGRLLNAQAFISFTGAQAIEDISHDIKTALKTLKNDKISPNLMSINRFFVDATGQAGEIKFSTWPDHAKNWSTESDGDFYFKKQGVGHTGGRYTEVFTNTARNNKWLHTINSMHSHNSFTSEISPMLAEEKMAHLLGRSSLVPMYFLDNPSKQEIARAILFDSSLKTTKINSYEAHHDSSFHVDKSILFSKTTKLEAYHFIDSPNREYFIRRLSTVGFLAILGDTQDDMQYDTQHVKRITYEERFEPAEGTNSKSLSLEMGVPENSQDSRAYLLRRTRHASKNEGDYLIGQLTDSLSDLIKNKKRSN